MSAAAETNAPTLGIGLTLAMAACAGVAVANLYYNQPMLGIMEAELGRPGLTGLIPTTTQIGYAAGLFLLVPLGDIIDRRRLIVTQFVLLAAALVMVAAAPGVAALMAASFAMGACAAVAQQVIPYAAALASPAQRGKTVGTVMAGVLSGILLSRTLAGFVAVHLGWRGMFWLAAPLALAAAGVMAAVLPRDRARAAMGYGAVLASVAGFWRREPALRRATLVQAALFGSFSAFWTVLALHVQAPPFGFGPEIAGLFGAIGLVGVLAAPAAGRIAHRRGPALVIAAGAALTLLSWAAFGLWGTVPGLVLGVIVLDFGVQSSLVSNQFVVFALDASARSRLNMVFTTGMFVGGAAGSGGATLAWAWTGWPGVCAWGMALAAAALLMELVGRNRNT